MEAQIQTETGESPEAVFAALGHETRLAILYELWKARDPEEHIPKQALSFAELRKRIGMRDGSQFNYHLKKLLGEFVHQTDDGYVLRQAGEKILSTVLAGTMGSNIILDGEPIDEPCPLCGGPVVLECGTERTLDFFTVRCTACEGAVYPGEGMKGTLSTSEFLPPTGVKNRSISEAYQAQRTWVKHKMLSMMEGVCPQCSGTVSVTPKVCENHEPSDGRVCPECNTIFRVWFLRVCDVCHLNHEVPSEMHMLAHPTAAAFYYEHGYGWDHDWHTIGTETVEEQQVVSTDPFELQTSAVADGEALDVTLDGDGQVVEVERG
ncbi:winged helix-turn-helix domain-containing protein [Haloferax sp. S1W]|uniref:winged helix-turn-helix domain-containing protein n=1 Tax=Haloferax sp. S1W TaxID=3377110 RepID=UPI0037CBF3BF